MFLSIFRMGILDFDVKPVTASSLNPKDWDCVVVVAENLDWPQFHGQLEFLKPVIEDAAKVYIYISLSLVIHLYL